MTMLYKARSLTRGLCSVKELRGYTIHQSNVEYLGEGGSSKTEKMGVVIFCRLGLIASLAVRRQKSFKQQSSVITLNS